MQEENYKTCSFSARFNEAIIKRGLKKKDFAALLGILPGTVSRYSKGKNLPTSDELFRMAKILGVTMDYLMGDDSAGTEISNEANFWREKYESLLQEHAELKKMLRKFVSTVASD